MALEQVFWGIIGVGGGALDQLFTPGNYIPFLITILSIRLLIFTFKIEERLDELIELIIEDAEEENGTPYHPPYDIEPADEEG